MGPYGVKPKDSRNDDKNDNKNLDLEGNFDLHDI